MEAERFRRVKVCRGGKVLESESVRRRVSESAQRGECPGCLGIGQ